jgi:uncharacterized membrane protein
MFRKDGGLDRRYGCGSQLMAVVGLLLLSAIGQLVDSLSKGSVLAWVIALALPGVPIAWLVYRAIKTWKQRLDSCESDRRHLGATRPRRRKKQ